MLYRYSGNQGSFRMKAYVIQLLLVVAALWGCPKSEQPGVSSQSDGSATPSGCYGFVRDGALLLDCGGSVKATPDLNLEGFAVSSDGMWLALRLSEAVKDKTTGKLINKSNVLNLQTKVAKPMGFYPHDLVSSCGTLLGVDLNDDSYAQRDILTGEVLRRESYKAFQCSLDKGVVIGRVKEEPAWRLMSGYPPQTTISSDGFVPFAVSANGQYVGFVQANSICVVRSSQQPKCVTTEGISPLSVSDTGEVLFARHTTQGCKCEGMWRFSPSTTESNDACLGIFRWHSEMAEPLMLHTIGRDP